MVMLPDHIVVVLGRERPAGSFGLLGEEGAHPSSDSNSGGRFLLLATCHRDLLGAKIPQFFAHCRLSLQASLRAFCDSSITLLLCTFTGETMENIVVLSASEVLEQMTKGLILLFVTHSNVI